VDGESGEPTEEEDVMSTQRDDSPSRKDWDVVDKVKQEGGFSDRVGQIKTEEIGHGNIIPVFLNLP